MGTPETIFLMNTVNTAFKKKKKKKAMIFTK